MARDKSAPFLASEFTATGNESMVKLKGDKEDILCYVSLPPLPKYTVYSTMSDICWPKQTSSAGLISGNQAQFMSQWESYEENQSAVISSVGMTREKLATIQPLAIAHRKPISPDLL